MALTPIAASAPSLPGCILARVSTLPAAVHVPFSGRFMSTQSELVLQFRGSMRGSSRLRGDAVDRRVVFEDPEAMQRRIREEKRALKRMLADEVRRYCIGGDIRLHPRTASCPDICSSQ